MSRQSTPKPPEVRAAQPTKTQNTVTELPEKDSTVNQQQQGGFGQGPQDNRLDNDFVQPDVSQKPVEPAANNIDFSQVLADQFASNPAFASVVEQAVRSMMSDPNATKFVDASQQSAASVEPDIKYLKHYRNDASPELVIQELDMSKDVPQLHPMIGRVIRFRRGHFFATTENQVKQIETLSNTSTHSADQRNSLGGIVGIYEDDGEVLHYCTAGCDLTQFVPTSSKRRWQAHMRAVHNVEA